MALILDIQYHTLLGLFLPLAACNSTTNNSTEIQPFVTGFIPDRDPEKLQRLYTKLATYLEQELGVPVEYKPVTDYAAAVTAFLATWIWSGLEDSLEYKRGCRFPAIERFYNEILMSNSCVYRE